MGTVEKKTKKDILASLLMFLLILVFASRVSAAIEFVPRDFQQSYLNKEIMPSVAMNSGAATYTIPIVVPPGRGGIAVPDLALVYNSSKGNGPLGVGWELEIGCIQKSTKHGLNYAGTEFVANLKGTSVELVPRPDWTPGTHYGAKNEREFTKFKFLGVTAGWEATTREGVTYHFGKSPSTRQYVDPNQVFKWCLDKIEDTNGNVLTVVYWKNQNEIYPDYIDYPGHKVDFIYDQGNRADKPHQYQALFKVVTAYRLTSVKTYATNSQPWQLARIYDLSYEDDTATGRSRLTQVNINSLPPLSFEYLEGGSGAFGNRQSTTLNSLYGYVLFADVNKDGLDDLIHRELGTVHVYISNGNGTFQSRRSTSLNASTGYLQASDINGDGAADLVHYDSGVVYGYISTLNGYFQSRKTTQLYSPSNEIFLADVSRDGRADVIQKYGAMVYVYYSHGDGFFDGSAQRKETELYSSGDKTSIADVNGDGLPDLVVYTGSLNYVNIHLALGDGHFGAYKYTDLASSGDSIHMGDINGDGLADLIHYSENPDVITTYLSLGTGFFTSGTYLELGHTGDSIHLGDANGDGLADLVLYSEYGATAYLYLSLGDGLFGSPTTKSLYQSDSVYLPDVNGDGLVDLVGFYEPSRTVDIYLAGSGLFADRLVEVTNQYGGLFTIQYESSFHYPTTLYLPFLMPVVEAITVDDGISEASYTTYYSYSNGNYDVAERDFRGFKGVFRTNPDTTIEESQFYVEDAQDFLKGLPQFTLSKTSGGASLLKQEFTWQTYPSSPSTWAFAKLTTELTRHYDNEGQTAWKQEDYAYDSTTGYWLTKQTTGTSLTETVTEERDYVNKGAWLWRLETEAISGGSTGLARQTSYSYDSHGNMLSRTAYNNLGESPTVNMTYDSYGNKITETDARGNTATLTYDASTQSFPATISYPTTEDGRTHVVQYPAYDYRCGKPTTKIDERGNTTSYAYDGLGRITQVDYPDGGQVLATYTDTYSYPSSPRYVRTQTKETAGSYINKYEYSDGLDRKIKTLTYGEGGSAIYSSVQYDNMGRIDLRKGPHFGQNPADHTYYFEDVSYDTRGRPIQIAIPDKSGVDGLYRLALTNFTYNGFSITKTDPDAKQVRQTKDCLERVIQVTEYSDSGELNTTYAYNAAGDLLTVTDHLGNSIVHTYDTLGRKRTMDDPDLGYWSYEYDKNGNLISKTNDRPDWSPVAYASAIYNTYDDMGRELTETREIQVSGVTGEYTTEFSYDYAGKLSRVTYPIGNYHVDYAYHSSTGLLNTVTGSDAEVYAQCTSYTPDGKVGNIAHGNGTATSYTYDPCSNRLLGVWSIDSADQDIQKKEYFFSPAGDTQRVTDGVNPATFAYTYDNIHRLRTETSAGVYPSETVEYNATGNITSKAVGSNTYVYSYHPARKHAVKTITFNGTPYQYEYDENGNMIEGPDFSEAGAVATREMWYYANDMPAVIQRAKAGNTVTTGFDYDGLGKRIRKSVWGGGDTYYLGDYYEIENGTPVMYIYAGGLRVAKVAGVTKNYYHKDHLQSSSVMTNASGLSVETTQYMPFGHTRTQPGPSVSNYKFTDQERDPEIGLYNYDARHYDPVIGRFISADSVVQDFYDPQTLNRYAYARNNPIKYIDRDGNAFFIPLVFLSAKAIAFAAAYAGVQLASAPARMMASPEASAQMSEAIDSAMGEVAKEQGKQAAFMFVGDAAGRVIGAGYKAVKGIRQGAEAAAEGAPKRAVIGESMDRVRMAADKLGAETFEGTGMEANKAWIQLKKAQGYEVYDIGPDFSRRHGRVLEGKRPDSKFYNMERTETKDYYNYFRLFDRTGKYKGGSRLLGE